MWKTNSNVNELQSRDDSVRFIANLYASPTEAERTTSRPLTMHESSAIRELIIPPLK